MRGTYHTMVPEAGRLLHYRAQKVVDTFPDREDLRCHEVARAVARVFLELPCELTVVDGLYGAVDHSWIHVLDLGPNARFILDTYSVARWPQVQLVEDNLLVTPRLYVPGPARTDIREEVVEHLVACWQAEGDDWRHP